MKVQFRSKWVSVTESHYKRVFFNSTDNKYWQLHCHLYRMHWLFYIERLQKIEYIGRIFHGVAPITYIDNIKSYCSTRLNKYLEGYAVK